MMRRGEGKIGHQHGNDQQNVNAAQNGQPREERPITAPAHRRR
jgi:hypothetical protein